MLTIPSCLQQTLQKRYRPLSLSLPDRRTAGCSQTVRTFVDTRGRECMERGGRVREVERVRLDSPDPSQSKQCIEGPSQREMSEYQDGTRFTFVFVLCLRTRFYIRLLSEELQEMLIYSQLTRDA